MQTRSGNVYRYNLARPTMEKRVEPKVERKVQPKVEKRVEPKVEVKVEPKVEVKVEPRLNIATGFARPPSGFDRRPSGFARPPSGFDRRPSGFVTPTRISDELAQFLKVPAGTLLARTEVSKLINGYIRSNNLHDANNGRVINPDAKLRKLLNVKPTDEVTYFNLQKYMKPHFARDY